MPFRRCGLRVALGLCGDGTGAVSRAVTAAELCKLRQERVAGGPLAVDHHLQRRQAPLQLLQKQTYRSSKTYQSNGSD